MAFIRHIDASVQLLSVGKGEWETRDGNENSRSGHQLREGKTRQTETVAAPDMLATGGHDKRPVSSTATRRSLPKANHKVPPSQPEFAMEKVINSLVG